jgi:solute carrier family 5 (sodium/glucose cotransporter), member 9
MRDQFMSAAANYTLLDAALHNNNRSCGLPPENSFHIFRSADDPNYPWPGLVFGLTILALNAWCTDQVQCTRGA